MKIVQAVFDWCKKNRCNRGSGKRTISKSPKCEEKHPDSDTITLYHGSNICVESPELFRNRGYSDVGDGFYLTDDIDAAQKWANRKGGESRVSVYELSLQSSRTLRKAIYFERPNSEWAEYIVSCHLGKGHRYDLVYGPIADNRLGSLIRSYRQGRITYDQLLSSIMPYRLRGNIVFQYAICSKKALNCIRYVGWI